MDMIDGIIVGAAAAAIGTILATKVLSAKPVGGGQPNQPNTSSYNATSGGQPAPLYVIDLAPTPLNSAPVAQVNPITEAAYNVQPVTFEHAFGPAVNQPAEEAVLPQ
jgi:hypothetical protein